MANKNAKIQAQKLEQFLSLVDLPISAIDKITEMLHTDLLLYNLKLVKMGQYERIYDIFYTLSLWKQVHKLPDLNKITTNQLELIKGIGRKTSRFFILHSRQNARCVILDTHVLKFIRYYTSLDAPKSTPTNSKVYNKLEKVFLDYFRDSELSIAEIDLLIWRSYNENNKSLLEMLMKGKENGETNILS